ncbi:MAG TPA: hypothetical protein VJ874_06115, partial [Candidatus Thermoplasmatota archaeon]|nr:hypothetical protein [Candidatus Thermoplasmatota archaeon]
LVWLIVLQLAWLLFLGFLVYGVLSGQVLDLDRRVRTFAARTLALGVVGITFLVVVESIERWLNISNAFVGIAAAGLLALSFRPLERLAERAARRVLPAAPVSLKEYQAAIAHALSDGRVSRHEQALLDDLKTRLP